MKLVTYSTLPSGTPRAGILVDKRIVDAGPGMLELIRGGAVELARLRELAARPPADSHALTDVKLHAPIPRPAKNVFCVGWNYLEHFEEGAKKIHDDRELPKHPVFFSKVPTAVTGPYDTIPFPGHVSTAMDWEAELGLIVGTRGKDLREADAMRHVFGFTVVNDVTLRDVQRRHGGQWHKGKSFDGTCPMGPCIVTVDELDPDNLRVLTRVNGVVKQDSSTRFLYFKLPRLLAELSAGMTLEPGDILSTGTPPGVGYARTPPEFLKPGDLLETEIEGIGTMRNPVA